jgi:hypothetical protein
LYYKIIREKFFTRISRFCKMWAPHEVRMNWSSSWMHFTLSEKQLEGTCYLAKPFHSRLKRCDERLKNGPWKNSN